MQVYKFWRIFLIFYCLIAIYDLQAQAIDSPLPPTHLRGRQVANKFASQTDLVNIIKWKAPNDGIPPVAYHIYRDSQLTKLAKIVPADGKLRFRDHNRKKGRTYCYFIVSVDEAGNQSAPAGIIFKRGKARPIDGPVLVSIEVSPVNPQVPIGFTEQFLAIGAFSDGTTRDVTNEVTWTSSRPRVASISNAEGSQGLATGLRQGTTVIRASLNCVSGATTLTVTSAQLIAIEVSPLNPTLPIGFTEQFVAIGLFDDGTTEDLTEQVTWTSSNPAVASISNEEGSEGLAIALALGETEIVATIDGISGSTTLTVTPAQLIAIEVFPVNETLPIGFTEQFIAIGLFNDNTTRDLTDQVTWTSSNPAVASISNEEGSEGLATGLSVGTTTITATLNGISGSTTLTVTSAVLLSIEVSPINPSIPVDLTQQFTAIGLFSDGTTEDLTDQVTWTSSDPTVAVISNAPDDEGLATGLSPGTTQIIATINGLSGSTTLTVTEAELISIAVEPINPSLAVGYAQQFIAIGTFSNGTTMDVTDAATWTSSNPTVAIVSNAPGIEGFAFGLNPGTTTITASLSGVSGSTTLTVTPAVLISITVDPVNPSIPVGFEQPFTATGIFSDGTSADLTDQVTWISSNPAVASISNVEENEGVATGLSVGTTTITAISNGVSGSTTLTVTPAILVYIEVFPVNPSIGVGHTQQFTAIGVFSDGTTQDLTDQVTWTSSDPTVAVISNAPDDEGLATGLNPGTTQIIAAINGLSGSTTLTVTPAVLVAISVEPFNPSIAAGFTQQFIAIGIFDNGTMVDLTDSVIWTSSDPTIAVISNAPDNPGLATGLSPGTTTITATLNGVSGSTTLTVTPAVLLALTVTPVDPSIAAGFEQPFTATGTFSDGTTADLTDQVTWTSSNPAVASISNAEGSEGVATGLSAGTTTITAISNGVSGSTTLTVTPAILIALTVTPVNPSIPVGFEQPFTATGTFSDGTVVDLTDQVSWISSNPAVASISNAEGSEGVATGLSVGSTTITAISNGVSGSTTLTVTPAVLVAIIVTPADATIGAGTTIQYTATGQFSDGSTEDLTDQVTWISSDPNVATISNAPGSEGLATGLRVTVTEIIATIDSISGSTSLTVTCPAPSITSPELLPAGRPNVPYSFQIQATGGAPPLTFSILDGSLPSGLTLDSTTGLISGTPGPTTGGQIYQPLIGVQSVCGVTVVQRISLPITF